MASGHASRTRRPNTWLLRPDCDVKKARSRLASILPRPKVERTCAAPSSMRAHDPKETIPTVGRSLAAAGTLHFRDRLKALPVLCWRYACHALEQPTKKGWVLIADRG